MTNVVIISINWFHFYFSYMGWGWLCYSSGSQKPTSNRTASGTFKWDIQVTLSSFPTPNHSRYTI